MPSSSVSNVSRESSILSLAPGILVDVLKTAFSAEYVHRLVVASVVPFVASTLWHFSRTVVEVTDDQPSLWVQMWLSRQSIALKRVRRVKLLSLAKGRNIRQGDPFSHTTRDEEAEKEGDGGRFAPPKLELQPTAGVLTWAWFRGWPVSVSCASDGGGNMESYGYNGGRDRSHRYTLTVWFAPSGKEIAKELLLQCFRILTRPSRPLSSVVVEGNIKETLRDDAIHFLNAEKWYVSKGIPYRRGYLLHGPPGCGKTSLITAIAGELRLPIVLVPLNDQGIDDRSLITLLGESPRDSIVLIEDIDCAIPRDDLQQAVRRTGQLPVTLSGLLNAIDGVGAQEGRLLFMTSNHVDRLDAALIRPGRVDVQFRLGNASKEAAGELFNQFFAASAEHGDEFNPKIVRQGRQDFLEKVEDGVHSFATLQGVLMLARDDPRCVAGCMDRLLASPNTEDPAQHSIRDSLEALTKVKQEALETERLEGGAQGEAGKVVVKRLGGDPTDHIHNCQMQQISFRSFATYGAPGLVTFSGVLYYEMEVVKAHGVPQFGFAAERGISLSDNVSDEGVGDNATSWAVDGMRGRKWHAGESVWKGSWKEGSVIGLAANVDTGVVAVSKDGIWDDKKREAGFGIVFRHESIKKGVFPCFSAGDHILRYCFGEEVKYGPPPQIVWDAPE